MWYWLGPLLGILGVVLAVVVTRLLRSFGGAVQVERAREMFRLQRPQLEVLFFQMAAASGKPRGLLWKNCQWDDMVEFVRERATGQIAALAAVTISFAAAPGGDMEGLPAVDNLRNASAVFYFYGGQWGTVGKAVFNMNPDEAIRHFQNQYERV